MYIKKGIIMCFSAGASFGAAAGLSMISLLSAKKASSTKKLIPLAISPFFFALQQACEGIVWVTLNNNDNTSLLHSIGVYGFLFFASMWWPIWIPYTLNAAETVHWRKKLFFITKCIGIISGITLFISWVPYTTGAHIINHHIDYPVTNYPFNVTNTLISWLIILIITSGYCIATIVPFFISSIAYIWIIGIATSIGLIASYIFYYMALPSLWCFFAAIISALLYFIIKKHHELPQ